MALSCAAEDLLLTGAPEGERRRSLSYYAKATSDEKAWDAVRLPSTRAFD